MGAAAVALITAGEAWERGACRRQEGPPYSLPQCTSPSIRGILKGTKVSGPQNEFVMALGREEIASLDLTTDAKADGFLIWIIDQIISYFQTSDFQTHVARRNGYAKSQKYAHCVHKLHFSNT